MKTIKKGFVAVMGLVLVQHAQAGSLRSNLKVTANVVGVCSDIKTSDVNFGNFAGSQVTANGAISLRCSEGAEFLVRLDGGQHFLPLVGAGGLQGTRQMAGPAPASNETLGYQLYKDAGLTSVWGSACVPGHLGCFLPTGEPEGLLATGTGGTQTLTVFGRIFASDLFHPTPSNGAYADLVGIQVDF
jgi:spore coat protein U-like protein